MGCGCGKKNSNPRNIKPVKILSMDEIRSKIIGSRPNNLQSIQPQKTINTNLQLFKPITKSFDFINYIPEKKTILLIYRNGNAESKYLKNLLNKMCLVNNYDVHLLEVELNHIINKDQLKNIPLTVFYHKTLYKKETGLFNVKLILDEFMSLSS
jgi:hypothetical protein